MLRLNSAAVTLVVGENAATRAGRPAGDREPGCVGTENHAWRAGSCGLHRRIGPDGLEIGYWIHPAFLRRGLATRVAHVLTGAALVVPGITRVEIHHDKANQASAGIPRELGYDWLGEASDEPVAPADTGIEWRWAMDKETWDARQPPSRSGR